MKKTACLSNYCNDTNFVKALSTISDDLYIVGLPPIAEYNPKNPTPCIASLVNTIWSLLQHRQNLIDKKRCLEQEIVAVKKEYNYSKEIQERLKNDLIDCQENLKKANNINILSRGEKFEDTRTLKCLKQEIKDLKSKLEKRETQFKNDFRRQQEEVLSLQAKIRRILYKKQGKKLKADSGTSTKCTNDNSDSNENIYETTIRSLQSNVHSLVKENLDLRKLLDDEDGDHLSSLLLNIKLDQNC